MYKNMHLTIFSGAVNLARSPTLHRTRPRGSLPKGPTIYAFSNHICWIAREIFLTLVIPKDSDRVLTNG